MQLAVTQQHIDRSYAVIPSRQWYSDPISRAVREALDALFAYVHYPGGIRVRVVPRGPGGRLRGEEYALSCDSDIRDWMRRYDAGDIVEPMTALLDTERRTLSESW